MIIKEDKEKLLKEFHEKYILDRYKEEFTKILEKYNTDRETIKDNLILKFDSVCKNAVLLQEKELKGEIKYIYFSILRTKILENRGQWRIDLYDKKWFLDKEECSVYMDLDFIYKPLFDHMKELSEKKREYGRIIKERDMNLIRQREANKYHALALNIIRDLLKSFFGCGSYKEMKKEKDMVIMAGEYMDEAIVIYSEGNN